MAIHLELNDYCNDCSEFVPTTKRLVLEDCECNRYVDICVTCEDSKKCEAIVQHLLAAINKSSGGELMDA